MRRRAALVATVLAAALTGACTSPSSRRTATSEQPTTVSTRAVTSRPVAPTTTATAPAPASSSTSSQSSTPPPTPSRAPAVPPLSAVARAAHLLDIRSVVPDAIVDLRYATTDNFTHVRLYPRNARCLVHESMAHGLRVAAADLHHRGYLMVFWDCYRPHTAQVRMYQVVPNPDWVAKPGPYAYSHEAARSVDVTLAYRSGAHSCAAGLREHGHCRLGMGTGFDDFTPRATAYATDGVSGAARDHRALLRHAMATGGLSVYSGEWWHFDGPGSAVRRPHLHVPVD